MPNPNRPTLSRAALTLAAASLLGLLAACKSTAPAPQQEFFDTGSSPFSRTFNASTSEACEAARRALLNQGYLATATRPDMIDASRDFQPNDDKHITVEFHVVCTPGDDPENTTIVYANAVQSGYALKKSDTSASVGFSVLGSVSLPIRSNSDSMVKVSSVTIESGPFYTQFFEYVGRYLHVTTKTLPVLPATIKATQLPPGPVNITVPPTSSTPLSVSTQQPAAAASPTTSTSTTAMPAAPAAAATQPYLGDGNGKGNVATTTSATVPAISVQPAPPAKPAQNVEPAATVMPPLLPGAATQ